MLPILPDQQIKRLIEDHEISLKDAKTLVELDNGERLDYFDSVLSILVAEMSLSTKERKKHSKIIADW